MKTKAQWLTEYARLDPAALRKERQILQTRLAAVEQVQASLRRGMVDPHSGYADNPPSPSGTTPCTSR